MRVASLAGVPAYLDDRWLEAWAEAVRAAGDALVHAADGAQITITTLVEDDDDGPGLAYHLSVGPDGVSAGRGAAQPSDLTFRQSRAVAEAVARGDLNAQEAFLHGHLVVGGDVRLLLDHGPVFRVLDDALDGLRATTTF